MQLERLVNSPKRIDKLPPSIQRFFSVQTDFSLGPQPYTYGDYHQIVECLRLNLPFTTQLPSS